MLLALVFSQAKAQVKPKFFDSEPACLVALRSGDFSYYTPVDTTNRGKNPATGSNKKVAPLEADACVHMKTTADWQTVVRPPKTNLRWELINGIWVPYADDACGNNADRVTYLPALPPTPSPFVARVPVVDTTVHKHIFSGQVGLSADVRHSGTIGFRPLLPEQTEVPYTVRRGDGLPGWAWALVGAVAAVGTYVLIDELTDKKKGSEGYTGPAFLRIPF